jgi:SOS-response transcriptional repressor LexA
MDRLERLNLLLKTRFSGKQKSFAEAIDRSQSHVSQWLKGRSVLGDASARNIEVTLDLPSGWLDHGDAVENVVHVTQGRLVPLLSFIQAGGWAEVYEGEPQKMIYARESNPGPHAFALRVEGDSMTSDSTPTFPEGTIIIVDPDRGPKAGDYVVARYGEAATFKRLMTDGAAWYLKPLNRDYRPIEIDKPEKVVVGVVIEYWTGGKL